MTEVRQEIQQGYEKIATRVESHFGGGAPGGRRVADLDTKSPLTLTRPSGEVILRAAPEAFFQERTTMPTARTLLGPQLHPTSSTSYRGLATVVNPAPLTDGVLTKADLVLRDFHEEVARVPSIWHRMEERRAYERARLRLPVRILRIDGQRELEPSAFLSVDISSSGLLATLPFEIDVDTPVDLQIDVLPRAISRCSVRMLTQAHVVRVQWSDTPGWSGLAFQFDDITFERSSLAPVRFEPSC